MSYGEQMKRLSPCGGEYTAGLIPNACNVLDVGCGRGDMLRYLAGRGMRLCGAEPDAENAAAARENCPEADITVCRAEDLPYPDGSFDAVLCECVLSLTEDPETAMGQMYRVLRPGGRLVITDLYCGETFRGGDGIIENIYSRGDMESFISGAGFETALFEDRTEDMYNMAAQMIFDGEFCQCVTPGLMAALKRLRPGYGAWVLEKPGTDKGGI